MKIKIARQHVSRRQSRPTRLTVKRASHGGSMLTAQPVRKCVKLFKKAVKGRPTDVSWLIRFGQLARKMGLTYDESASVIRSHCKKLRGNTVRGWIENGLRLGYENMVLAS